MDLLKSPAYAVPLVVNLTGSVWFFLLIGKAGRLCCGLFLLRRWEEGGIWVGGIKRGGCGRGRNRREEGSKGVGR